MKRLFFLIIILLGLTPQVIGQIHFADVLKAVEENSPVLKSARVQSEAAQSAVHVGLLLPNPTVEAGYFFPSPNELGVRWDLRASQSFEFPTVIAHRAHLRDLQEQAAAIGYQTVRAATLLNAQLLCADQVYYNAVFNISSRRCVAAFRLVDLYQKRYQSGECSVLEYNRAQMYLADVQDQASRCGLQSDHVTHELQTLLGSDNYQLLQMEYEEMVVEADFDQWFHRYEMNHPEMRMLDNRLSTSQQQLALSKSQWMPEFSVGYASENRVNETFRGVTVGLTIPLWSQQRAVKASRLALEAAQEEMSNQRYQLYNSLQCIYHRYAAMMDVVSNLKQALEQYNSVDLLEKALVAGEINLEQYLLQVDSYYDLELRLREASHELEVLHLNLYAIEL